MNKFSSIAATYLRYKLKQQFSVILFLQIVSKVTLYILSKYIKFIIYFYKNINNINNSNNNKIIINSNNNLKYKNLLKGSSSSNNLNSSRING